MKSVLSCNNKKLLWKIWIAGSKIESRIGSLETAKSLIERSLVEISQKKQSDGFLEYVRFNELIGSNKVSSTHSNFYLVP